MDDASSDESKENKEKAKKIMIKNEITPHFSKSSAKDALLNEVSRKCCYGTTAAKQVRGSVAYSATVGYVFSILILHTIGDF